MNTARGASVGFGVLLVALLTGACSKSDKSVEDVADASVGIDAKASTTGGKAVTTGSTAAAASQPVGKQTTAANCIEVGKTCSSDAECCFDRCERGICVGSTGACEAAGTSCVASAECCSGRCEALSGSQRVCTASSSTVLCRAGGALCATNGDCCSGTCGKDGTCPIMAQCQTAGEPCTGFHECCSGTCADPGTGVPICQYVSGCRPVGEVCSVDDDCCGLRCASYGDTGIKRCAKPAGCMYPGEVCWTGQSANCCPPGRNGGNRLCEPTSLGVRRCFTSGTTTECIPDGQPCAFADECCSELCLPNAEGELVCGPNCVPVQGMCRADADCCEGQCIKGSCQPSDVDCVPLGAYCDKPEDCCANICDTDAHRCMVTIM